MKNTNYTCEMIEDLIPLAAEGICSEESRKAVEAHIAQCESCRKLYEAPVVPSAPKAKVPDETNTFRKVYRKIAKSRRLNKILGVMLGILVVPLAVLTFGSITQNEVIPSFEGIHQDYKVYRFAKTIANGDFRPYLEMMQERDDLLFQLGEEKQKEILDTDTARAAEIYNQYSSGKRVKHVFVHSAYEPNGITHDHWTEQLQINPKHLRSTAMVWFDDGTKISLDFADIGDGRTAYIGYGLSDTVNKELNNALLDTLTFAVDHQTTWKPFLENCFEHPIQRHEQNFANRMQLIANRFAPAYRERLVESFSTFYKDGIETPEMTVSELHYDDETKSFYYETALTATDAKGSAILTARMYESPDGLIPPEQDACTVSTNGCTPELATSLKQIFG